MPLSRNFLFLSSNVLPTSLFFLLLLVTGTLWTGPLDFGGRTGTGTLLEPRRYNGLSKDQISDRPNSPNLFKIILFESGDQIYSAKLAMVEKPKSASHRRNQYNNEAGKRANNNIPFPSDHGVGHNRGGRLLTHLIPSFLLNFACHAPTIIDLERYRLA
jgi:hypothetical protein